MRVACTKHFLVWLSCYFGLGPVAAWAAPQDLPAVDVVLRQLAMRARSQRTPEPQGYFLCTKQTITEEFDDAGRVTKKKVKVKDGRSHPGGAAEADKWSSKNGFNLDEELLRRYLFTVVHREMFNGRRTLLLTFVPKDPPAPVRRLQDRLLNRTIGTVWVDEADHELVKATISLAEPVSFGILGAVDSFSFSFERVRDEQGNWLTRWTDTIVDARKFLKPIQTRKRVDWSDFKKLAAQQD